MAAARSGGEAVTRALRTRPSGSSPPQTVATSAHGRNMGLLWVGQFVNTAGLMMLVPIMPFYLRQIGTSGLAETQTWAGVAIAAPALALTVATPLWGRLGDRIGRKWMVVRALLGLAVAMIVMATASSPLVLMAGRLLQGTLGGVVEAAAAFAGSTGSDEKRGSALGKSFSATAAGALAGPIAGGLLVGSGGLPQLMLGIAGSAVALAVACAWGLREPGRTRAADERSTEARPGERERPSVLRVPGAVALALAAIAAYFGVYGLIPVYAEHVESTAADRAGASLWVGVLHSVMWGATLLGSFWWGKHNDLTGRPLRTFALAAAGCAASIAIMSLPLDPYAMIPFRLLQGFCFAALAQSAFLHFSKHAPGEHKSTFVSTANSYLLIGQSAGPLLAGPLVAMLSTPSAVLVMAGACSLGCLLAIKPCLDEKRSRIDPGELTDNTDLAGIDATRPIPLTSQRAGVAAVPFRGWLIDPRHLGSLATRYATPWNGEETSSTPVAWQRRGVIVQDRQPAFYAYEQTGPHGTLSGVLAAVHLDSALRTHEEVVPERATQLARFMDHGRMNLDPALLGVSGDGHITRQLARTTRQQPITEVRAQDGQTHRLWRITDRSARDEITADLGTRAAFIADGHHRCAAARQHRRAARAEGRGPGPWDHFPALLVDISATPLRLGPVHRILPQLDPHHALRTVSARFRVHPLHGPLRHWLAALKHHADREPAFLLATPRGGFLLTDPHPDFLSAALADTPPPLRSTHVAVLDAALVHHLWHARHVECEPNAATAIHVARRTGGVAVLTNPPSQHDLRTAASSGIRLPPRSTSFGPKPHPGLVFRTLDEHEGRA
ncbi:MFS transporter [Saccharopolyspora mangrovi]|uniref:MFS transporter n=1 Tax=Saccharopolyspora mangrovi TaxID=3082379 RepID=A0ABU6A868_9PSEU|nr:MFS transporter [Saccharopolyspora sp. S2-29]MEB3367767.1 MFS transporter [Saccharopolyspora sp. S2-29]